MTTQRLNEYFAEEAADYLDQLDRLLRGSGSADVPRLLRLATGIRGSMQMAGADAIAAVAARLEDAVRTLPGEPHLPDPFRAQATRAVTDIRSLVAAIERWGVEEERLAADAVARWDAPPEQQGSAERPVVAIDSLFYDDEGPHILEPAAGPGSARTAVPIEELLFRGEEALREALRLRPSFEAIVRGDTPSDRPASDLLEELFDLIDLGLGAGATEV